VGSGSLRILLLRRIFRMNSLGICGFSEPAE
jgi:hypothetical protein